MVLILKGNAVTIKRVDLVNVLKSTGTMQPRTVEKKRLLLDHVIHLVGAENVSFSQKNLILKTIDNFSKTLFHKLKQVRGCTKKLEKRNEDWILSTIIVSGENAVEPSCSNSCRGRPKVEFSEASLQTKRRRLQLDLQKTEEELCLAAEMKLRENGKRDAANILHKIRTSPNRATRLKRIEYKEENCQLVAFSPEEALALFVSFKFTRHQYIGLRDMVIKKGLTCLFPTYNKIIEAKKMCYPANISVNQLSVEVPLQNLLDHTVSRIIQTQNEVISSLQDASGSSINLLMTYKWGSDGSGSQSNYRQICEGDDSSILATSVVPLQLVCNTDLDKKIIIWQNPRTSSTRFCRPLRLQFVKESDEVIKSEFFYVENQIKSLCPTEINIGETNCVVKHELIKTMVDGKVCNSLTSTSSQKCYLCKAGSSDFNKLEYIKSLSLSSPALSLGLSTLHAYIRFFECLIHISYRLNLKVWRVPQKLKEDFNNRKQLIIRRFREETGLLIDIPKVGFGNTNDGNTARRFFSDPNLSSQITGLDQNLIYRFSVILQTLNCNFQVNSNRFQQYAYETAELYVHLYGWYPMPPTVHKILMHSKEVMDHFLLPIGQLGEDAQESRHKEIKYYREHNTRKMSRLSTNEDLFNILMISSDPLISSIRSLPSRKESIFNSDIIDLLEAPQESHIQKVVETS